MSVIESILKDLKGVPMTTPAQVVGHIYPLSEKAQKERTAILKQTHGCLSEVDGEAFEKALAGARRLES